jgi:DtxR family Mn-dependent transcriptional regulator
VTSRTPAISHAMEDYLKTIHQIAEETDGAAVQTQALADRLGVTTASVTEMVKRLDRLDLVEHAPYRGVGLTPRGTQVALEILRHHRLLELFLVEQLGMSWEDVHTEADRLEHVISETLEDRIADKLGQPDRDPHGDPIPARDGSVPSDPWMPLAGAAAGTDVEILRVSDGDPALLQYLAERGLVPGARVEVIAVDELAGVLTLALDGTPCTLALATAAAITVRDE